MTNYEFIKERDNTALTPKELADKLFNEYQQYFTGTKKSLIKRIREFRALNKIEPIEQEITTTRTEDKLTIQGTTRKQIKTQQDLFEYAGLDPNEWIVKKLVCGSYDSHVKLGKFSDGKKKDDEHKLVHLWKISAVLEPNKSFIDLQNCKESLINEMKTYAPKYEKLPYINLNKDGLLLEIFNPDLHLNKLSWGAETGQDSDIKIATECFKDSISYTLNRIKGENIKQILFPHGNDFFQADSIKNETSHGTIVDVDSRWKKSYPLGRKLSIWAIEQMYRIAPVHVSVIQGNHDSALMFYLGDSLECWFHNNNNVFIDNTAPTRKKYIFGNVLLGFTHCYTETVEKLPMLMMREWKEDYAKTNIWEWHCGHLHTASKKEHSIQIANRRKNDMKEFSGVVVRFVDSLSSTDNWHYEKGYIGNRRTGEAYLWHEKNGLYAQFPTNIIGG